MRLLGSKYSHRLLAATLIGFPFLVVGLLAILDIFAGGVNLVLEGENPLLVLNANFTRNNIGLSKSFLLSCWPLLISSVLCLQLWFMMPLSNGHILFWFAVAVSFAVPTAAYIGGQVFNAWPFPLSLLSYILIWKEIRIQQDEKNE